MVKLCPPSLENREGLQMGLIINHALGQSLHDIPKAWGLASFKVDITSPAGE